MPVKLISLLVDVVCHWKWFNLWALLALEKVPPNVQLSMWN